LSPEVEEAQRVNKQLRKELPIKQKQGRKGEEEEEQEQDQEREVLQSQLQMFLIGTPRLKQEHQEREKQVEIDLAKQRQEAERLDQEKAEFDLSHIMEVASTKKQEDETEKELLAQRLFAFVRLEKQLATKKMVEERVKQEQALAAEKLAAERLQRVYEEARFSERANSQRNFRKVVETRSCSRAKTF